MPDDARYPPKPFLPGLAPPSLTLGDAIADAVAAGMGREIESRLYRIAELIGLPPKSIPFTPPFLREHFLGRTGAEYGVAEGTMRNYRWALRKVALEVGIIDPWDGPLSNIWTVQLALLVKEDKGEKDDRMASGLRRFARFCSQRHIAPDEANEDTLQAFEARIVDRSLIANPHTFVADARQTWNRCYHIPGWIGRRLASARYAGKFILPKGAYPPSFVDDLAGLGERLAGGLDGQAEDFTDVPQGLGGRNALPLKESSIRTRQDHARWAASALAAAGVPIEQITSLTVLVTPLEHARMILRFLYERAGNKPSAAAQHVAELLLMVAKHVARLPQERLNQLRTWGRKVKLSYTAMTPKNQRQIEQALTPACEEALLALPEVLMNLAHDLLPESPRQAISVAMQAVGVSFLTRVPIRLGNLVGLEWRHLQRADSGKPEITSLFIPAEETKTGADPITAKMPEEVDAILQPWIHVFRPLIAEPGCLYLFPGHGTGGPITPQSMRDAVVRATKKHVGVRLTPHQFRHLAACSYLKRFPGHYADVCRFLGNKLDTVLRSYSFLENPEAFRRLNELRRDRLDELRGIPGGKVAPRQSPGPHRGNRKRRGR